MMNQTNQNSSRSHINEGWSVVVYSGDRRLLCSLHPSHGWMFIIGLVSGLLLAALWYSASLSSVRNQPVLQEQPAQRNNMTPPPLQVD